MSQICDIGPLRVNTMGRWSMLVCIRAIAGIDSQVQPVCACIEGEGYLHISIFMTKNTTQKAAVDFCIVN